MLTHNSAKNQENILQLHLSLRQNFTFWAIFLKESLLSYSSDGYFYNNVWQNEMWHNRTVHPVFQGNIWASAWQTAASSTLCVLGESWLRAQSANQNLQCAHAFTHISKYTINQRFAHSHVHVRHRWLLLFAVCQYQVLIHKTNPRLKQERQNQLGWNAPMRCQLPTKLSLASV